MDTQVSLDWWPSPAKLNLFLHITGRNDKGYHLLQSLFQMLDVGDSLAFIPNDSGDIRLATAISGVNTEDNLIYRAARLLQSQCKIVLCNIVRKILVKTFIECQIESVRKK